MEKSNFGLIVEFIDHERFVLKSLLVVQHQNICIRTELVRGAEIIIAVASVRAIDSTGAGVDAVQVGRLASSLAAAKWNDE